MPQLPGMPDDQERVNARPEGQLRIDHQKDRIASDAAEHGWTETARDPALVLSKGERTITVEFNNAGMPKSATWGGGDEFPSMGSSGVFYLNALKNWYAWESGD